MRGCKSEGARSKKGGEKKIDLALLLDFAFSHKNTPTDMASSLALSSSSSHGLAAVKNTRSISFAVARRAASRGLCVVQAAGSSLSSSSSTSSIAPRRPPMASFLRGLMGSKVGSFCLFSGNRRDTKTVMQSCVK